MLGTQKKTPKEKVAVCPPFVPILTFASSELILPQLYSPVKLVGKRLKLIGTSIFLLGVISEGRILI